MHVYYKMLLLSYTVDKNVLIGNKSRNVIIFTLSYYIITTYCKYTPTHTR